MGNMADEQEKDELKARGNNRSQQPSSVEFREFMGSDWGPRPAPRPRAEVADYLPARHAALSKAFPGERLVIPAGEPKVRANDTDYRFRAHSAFSHMTGMGQEKEPGAVLVFNPREEGGHDVTLYIFPRASRSSEEFYADAAHGEFWVGARPSLRDVENETGIHTADVATLRDALAKDLGQVQMRVVPASSVEKEALVEELRQSAGQKDNSARDLELAQALSELRLRKDPWEVAEIRKAVVATHSGFDNIIASLPAAVAHSRGERVVEGAFFQRAREEGNGLGYETIAASGNNANTLHWQDNDGQVKPGDLILIDAGVELDSLYTADITRTFPVSGKFTADQAEVYQAVLDAANYALEIANRPGARFRDLHAAAMEVLADRLEKWGMLPGTAAESLRKDGPQWHRRWMPHGTSHHLGLDVHDCAAARREMYVDAKLEPGMVFTIEPGLYFRADDLKVPERFRGIGVRIEDDVLVTENGVERISEDIPRTIEGVENWMAQILNK
ncbi:Xaa-Pro aminopeptidase [Actinobaculum suis]|uniref:Xaa-Pro aminopeptidase n=2 Tax=Actinobaculum suis TaxID=1657 RepID=A0A1G7DBN8_9ACTO|nr:Xaa-Pro aminopeptidase [Actinobaculum suis]